ncbi:VOC family protein [Microtetraspora fusca]|uniref:VOC family protein n=1 Tax=Microtetraspora fusca TaxID=1997 RepID=UPI000830455F|nr:VOC family protein [Microtetraspora fusca]
MTIALDHLVYAVPDLEAGVAAFATLTGVAPSAGGAHPGGTANYLVGLGDGAYLEIIGPDPSQPGVRPRAFGLEALTEPTLAAWAVRTGDIEATVRQAREAGYDPGSIEPLSRRTPDGTLLEWRLTRRDDPAAVRTTPFIIDWGSTAHPSASGIPALSLASFTVIHPEPASARGPLDALGVTVPVERGPAPGLRAVLDTPEGQVTLA